MPTINIKPGQSLRIGRAAENDLVLNDRTVSRHHAIIRSVRGHYYLIDHDSTNGTYLFGLRIKDMEVREGDLLRFGDVETTLAVVYPILRGRARCANTGKTFGIRYKQGQNGWLVLGTFELDERRARSAIFTTESIRVVGFLDYPGCPECHQEGIVGCSCGEVCCKERGEGWVTCPSCGDNFRTKHGDMQISGVLDQG
jgi:hypothetical protein